MGKARKVAISLPDDTLRAVEEKRLALGESRSEFFRRAVEKLLKDERENTSIKDYLCAYRDMPESAGEIEAAQRLGSAVLAGEPWD